MYHGALIGEALIKQILSIADPIAIKKQPMVHHRLDHYLHPGVKKSSGACTGKLDVDTTGRVETLDSLVK
jgi:hypothetical protein